MSSSSSSAADTPSAGESSEETLSNVAAEELRPGDTVEFGASWMSSKRRAVVRLPKARPKRARGGAKAVVPGGSQPSLAAKAAAPGSGKLPESAKAAGAGGTKSAPEGAAMVRELPSPGKRSGEGQLVAVSPAVAATASTAIFGVKGGAFSAGGEVSVATAVKDEAGTVSRRLQEASLQLNQADDFADRVASGTLTAGADAEMARAEEVEDFGRLNSALPEAEADPVMAEAEVYPAPLPETGEGSHTAPASTVSGGGSPAATVPMAEDPPKAATEPAAEDPVAAAGSSQVA
eukprot:XP_020400395.1 myristoylated alanine-rich C-kinase substrate-like [Zea mays]